MDLVVERVLTKVGPERVSELQRLVAAHPDHATALHAMVAAIDGTERLLDGGFAAGPATQLPQTIADYRIERELGRGGMGVVYAAIQPTLGRRVAVKVLSAPRFAHQRILARFAREAQLLARLEHKGIVRVIEAGTADGIPFYAMEYVDGAPLSAVLSAVRRHGLPTATGATITAAVLGAAPQPDAMQTPVQAPSDESYVRAIAGLAAEVAEALAFAHAAGVIHRDVKPGNVLVRRDGTAVLTDFGIARLDDAPSLTVTGDFAGTPFYVSPEQARGEHIDHRTDVFSLGVTLYELLTLTRPFDGSNTTAVLTRIQRTEPIDPCRLNGRVTAELAAIVMKALAKEPAHRYASAGDMAADLRAFLAGDPVTARPPTWSQRCWRWCRREPWQAIAVATAATAATLLTVLSLSFTSRLIRENTSTKAALTLAERNFATATQAVDEMLSRVGERELADVPQMDNVRRKLLQRALEFYEGFAKDHGGDRDVRFRLACARGRVAWIRRLMSDEHAAVETANAAIAEFDRLLAADPTDGEVILERAETELTLATSQEQLGSAEAAQAAFNDVLATLEPLKVRAASERARRLKIAFARYGTGQLLRYRDGARSRTILEQAAQELSALFEETPDDAAIAARLINARISLARIALAIGDRQTAEAGLRQVDEILKRAPDSREVLVQRCSIHEQWAIFYQDTGRLENAAAEETLAMEAWRKHATAFPETPFLRERLAQAWTNLGNIRRYLGQHQAAVAATRESIELGEQLVAQLPEIVGHRAGLGRSLLNLGSMLVRSEDESEHPEGETVLERALGIAEQLRRDEPDQAEHARLAADCLGERAYVRGQSGDHAAAAAAYLRAADVWGETVARHPQELGYQDGQVNMLTGAANELMDEGDTTGALAILDSGVGTLRANLAKDSRRPARRRYARNALTARAMTQLTLGHHQQACADLVELDHLTDGDADAYEAATTAAWCMDRAPESERHRYADATLAALGLIVDRGYRCATSIATDEKFASLRDQPGFKQLMQRIER